MIKWLQCFSVIGLDKWMQWCWLLKLSSLQRKVLWFLAFPILIMMMTWLCQYSLSVCPTLDINSSDSPLKTSTPATGVELLEHASLLERSTPACWRGALPPAGVEHSSLLERSTLACWRGVLWPAGEQGIASFAALQGIWGKQSWTAWD